MGVTAEIDMLKTTFPNDSKQYGMVW